MLAHNKSRFLFAISLALAFATGITSYPLVIHRFLPFSKPPEQTAAHPKGPWIEKIVHEPKGVHNPEKIYLGLHVFQYQGSWIDCWLEQQKDGVWTKVQEILGVGFTHKAKSDPNKPPISDRWEGVPPTSDVAENGFVVWRVFKDPKTEKVAWDLQLLGSRPDGFSMTVRCPKKFFDLPVKEPSGQDPEKDGPGNFTTLEWFPKKGPQPLLGEITLFDGELFFDQVGFKSGGIPYRLKCRPIGKPEAEKK